MPGNSCFLERILENFERQSEEKYCTVLSKGSATPLTWADLEGDCQAVMQALSEIDSGVVLIFLRHSTLLHGAFFGSMMAGHIPSFMPCSSIKQDSDLYWSSHQKLLNHIQPSAIITSSKVFGEMTEAGLDLCGASLILIESLHSPSEKLLVPTRSKDEIALLQHSSGTTGLKKGVALSYDAIERHAISYSSAIGLTPKDTIVSWLPLYHDMGLMACMITPAYVATPVVHIDPFEWIGQPHLMFDAIEEHSATFAWMPNFAFEHLALYAPRMPQIYNLSSMRAFISCAEVCKPESFDRFLVAFQSHGVTPSMLQACYAMAETVFAITQTSIEETPARILVDQMTLNRGDVVHRCIPSELEPNAPRYLVETGSVVDGLNIEIVDEQRTPLPDMTIGEVAISGSFLFKGYHGHPELTDKSLFEGWYLTHDLGFIDSGHLYVLGRTDDLIIVQGRNIYAHQVESLVSTINGIRPGRICAFGMFDARVGSESIIIVCEVSQALDIEESRTLKSQIYTLLQSTIEVIPKRIKFVDPGWLMKTSSGKVGRKENKIKYTREIEELNDG
jgi:fatty-acyl-CoA synthase